MEAGAEKLPREPRGGGIGKPRMGVRVRSGIRTESRRDGTPRSGREPASLSRIAECTSEYPQNHSHHLYARNTVPGGVFAAIAQRHRLEKR
jgi:hypothetical protein